MSEPDYKDNLVGVFGHPVAENPSVVMQEAGFRELGLHDWRYLTINVRPQDLADAFRGLRAFDMRGINLTIPHKVAVLAHLDQLSSEAELIGAVNTVVRDGDRLIGRNTDGKGFLRSLRNDARIEPSGKRFAILGAGGAARAIGVELALAGAAHLTIVNRTRSRGEELVRLLNERTPATAQFVPWHETYRPPTDIDVLVNATSIGLYPNINEIPDVGTGAFRPGLLVCDVIPNPPRTRFLKEAEAGSASTLDGLGMLVYQGAIAFEAWTGHHAPTEAMLKALEAAFTE